MREREQVAEMATANGCGRHVAFACPGPYGIAGTDGERISAAIQLSGRSVAILRTNGNNISTRSLAGLRQIGPFAATLAHRQQRPE
jgi:hypothetical protein